MIRLTSRTDCSRRSALRHKVFTWTVASLLWPAATFACSVCFGAGTGDNPNAAGLNAGVGVLFAVLLPIQILLLLLFVRIARRSSGLNVDVAGTEVEDNARRDFGAAEHGVLLEEGACE